MRPVEHDSHRRPVRAALAAAVYAMLGECGGRVEPLAGEQDSVGKEPGELPEIARPAFAQVGQRLRRDARGNCGQCHQVRVGVRLAAQHNRWQVRREHRTESRFPAAPPAEQPGHDAERVLQQSTDVVGRRARGVRQAPGPAAGPGGQQVGVGRREQDDHRPGAARGHGAPGGTKGSPAGAPSLMSRSRWPVSMCSATRSPSTSSLR